MRGLRENPEPDPRLIQRARQGETAALGSLLAEVGPIVAQWAMARTGDPDEAADLAQEVLILMTRKLDSFRGDSRFLTWLFTVTRNQAIERHRSLARRERKMERLTSHMVKENPVVRGPESEIDEARIRNVVGTFLRELPQRQREVFQMAEIQGLTSPEIGQILGLEPGSVRAALFKARRTLRRRILDQHPELVEEYAP
ncbi:MAG: sigma-70 family RNA polymerase sigma factor [Gemmatimonadota bacterium]